MSHPFTTPQNDPFNKQKAIMIPERGTHVPTWYVPHHDPHQIVVKQKGIPLLPTFTVGEIAPERRWAVSNDGEVLEQHQFRNLYLQWLEEFYRVARSEPQKIPGKVDRDYIPNVLNFVRAKVDPVNPKRLVRIGYDPNRTAGAKPEVLVDGSGENPRPRLEVLVEQYAQNKGKLTEGERLEVEAYLEARRMRAESEFGQRQENPPEPEKPAPVAVTSEKQSTEFEAFARCGKGMKKKNGLKMHERNCPKCNALLEMDASRSPDGG